MRKVKEVMVKVLNPGRLTRFSFNNKSEQPWRNKSVERMNKQQNSDVTCFKQR